MKKNKHSKPTTIREGDFEWTIVNGRQTSPRLAREIQILNIANHKKWQKKELKALPRLVNPAYGDMLRRAERVAEIEGGQNGIEQAKEIFLKHWFRANTALRTIATCNDANLIQEVLPWIRDAIGSLQGAMRNQPAVAAPFLFESAKKLCRDIHRMAQANPPPSWLIEFAALEYQVPWLMINGKPAPGFSNPSAPLKWGHNIIKQGKSRFDAPQTKWVAQVLHRINHYRMNPVESSIETGILWRKGVKTKFPNAERDWISLPPLTSKTQKQWWPYVEDEIRIWMGAPILTAQERKTILATLPHRTEGAVINEFLKRCKIAFKGLCPVD